MNLTIEKLLKRTLALTMSLSLLVPSLGAIAGADIYDVADGEIQITVEEDGKQYVSQMDLETGEYGEKVEDNDIIITGTFGDEPEGPYDSPIFEADVPVGALSAQQPDPVPDTEKSGNPDPVPDTEKSGNPDSLPGADKSQVLTVQAKANFSAPKPQAVVSDPQVSYQAPPAYRNSLPGINPGLITVQTANGHTAIFTIQDLSVALPESEYLYGIDISDGSSALMKVKNTNWLENTVFDDLEQGMPAIHIADKDSKLTITDAGGEKDSLLLVTEYGAGIGSATNEDMAADIHITGNTTLQAFSSTGACIGTGDSYIDSEIVTEDWIINDMSGSITIDGNTRFTGFSKQGAVIGSGTGANMSGNVTIQGNAEVNTHTMRGTGVGSGGLGEEPNFESGTGSLIDEFMNSATSMSGVITVDGSAAVNTHAHGGNWSNGIGSGAMSSMTGKINLISGTVQTFLHEDDSPDDSSKYGNPLRTDPKIAAGHIGSGPSGVFTGSIFLGRNILLNPDGTSPNLGRSEGKVIFGKPDLDFYRTHEAPINGLFSEEEAIRWEKEYNSYMQKHAAKDPMFASITIEQGATICGKRIMNHQDADPFLHCMVDPNKTEEMGHVHVYITAPEKETEAVPMQSLYWVTSEGKLIPFQAEVKDGILTVIAEPADAQLNAPVEGLKILMGQGIHTIVFRTSEAESSFAPQQAVKDRRDSDLLQLTHQGSKASMTIAGEDCSNLLK